MILHTPGGPVETAPCEKCGQSINLQLDPPCDHGTVQCAEHDEPDCCIEAARVLEDVARERAAEWWAAS